MSSDEPGAGWGCGGCLGALFVIGAVVATVISIAALIDPFSWMPPLGEIWAECDDDYATSVDECDLEERYPGFWGHAVVNFAWAAASVGSLTWAASAALRLREARAERFSRPDAVESYERARENLALASCACAGLAALPILVGLI